MFCCVIYSGLLGIHSDTDFMKHQTAYMLQAQLQQIINAFMETGEAYGELGEVLNDLMQAQSTLNKKLHTIERREREGK